MHERYLITGDIHGCSEEFKKLLKIMNLQTESDTLIILGDLFDRGPDSYGVYCIYKELQKKMGDRLILLMGNHEDMLLNAIEEPYVWRINGAKATIDSFAENNMDYKDLINEFADLPLFYRAPDFTCVHGGVEDDEEMALEDMPDQTLIWDRRCARLGYYNGDLIIAGHTPVKSPFIWQDHELKTLEYNRQYDLPQKGFMCIDTGCVYGYKLTGLVIMDGKMMLRGVDSEQRGKNEGN